MTTPPTLLTASDVAERLRVAVRTVHDWHAQALLPRPIFIGSGRRAMRWDADELTRWWRTPGPDGKPLPRDKWEQVREQLMPSAAATRSEARCAS